MLNPAALRDALNKAKADLLAERTADRHWEGELSASALSTATAISALCSVAQNTSVQNTSAQKPGPHETARPRATDQAGPTSSEPASAEDAQRIEAGFDWLLRHQSDDGGWGDTDKSHSNISTTMLVVAAIHLASRADALQAVLERAQGYIDSQGGIEGLRRRYGKDKTFAVPILSNYALAGLIDWREVSPLPFEMACLPQKFYRWARMPVVSYAIPALVAIGQARFCHRPPRLPWMRWIRQAAIEPSLRVLQRMQPHSGGYLEAVPLTSFVAMSLASAGRGDHAVPCAGLAFIRDSQREDGSWPIDTNLATWNTSLAINALAMDTAEDSVTEDSVTEDSVTEDSITEDSATRTGAEQVLAEIDLDWLLACQHTQRHAFTGAAPGGWGWTNLSGAVPDADDTAGALLALAKLRPALEGRVDPWARVKDSAALAVTWLLDLQNRDGGWPTFCRGWGKLPFDRSGADLTAHAMRALQSWSQLQARSVQRRIERAVERGRRYLDRQQRADGSWFPLWFGHQDHPAEENPVFGTARVLRAYQDLGWTETSTAQRGYKWLESVQQADGGWCGCAREHTAGFKESLCEATPSSVEETALALEALLGSQRSNREVVSRGLEWLVEAVLADRHRENAPIGFYFAKLWYHERLYPLVFTVAALGAASRHWAPQSPRSPTADTP